jgi:hypothetical protein
MDADGSQNGDDSIPLSISETRIPWGNLARSAPYGHFLFGLYCD